MLRIASTGCTTSPGRGATEDHRCRCGEGDREDSGGVAAGRDALVDPVDGFLCRDVANGGVADLAGVRVEAALVEGSKLSPDPLFIDKVRDIVGLYLNPPDAALVLCVDEKTQVQALDRTAPVLPLLPGVPERRTHDYRRYGTTNLYAALDVASGNVIGTMTSRHRAAEFLAFLKPDRAAVPADLDVHVVLDNVSTHKTPAIQRWLVRHPRFHFHFTPTYSSWLNLVERWFGELTTKWLRRGTHRSVRELTADPGLDHDLERQPPAIRVAQDRRPDPRILATTATG